MTVATRDSRANAYMTHHGAIINCDSQPDCDGGRGGLLLLATEA